MMLHNQHQLLLSLAVCISAVSLLCVGVVEGSRVYYCSSPGILSIGDADFTVITSTSSCEFRAVTYAAYWIEIEQWTGSGDGTLKIKDSSQTLLSKNFYNFRDYMRTIRSKRASSSLSIQTGSYARLKIRVRRFSSSGCPPTWSQIGTDCYGTSSQAKLLTYSEAQSACNSMQANLLLLPTGYYSYSKLQSLKRDLPRALVDGAWIGLTDRPYGQFNYRWLDGRSYSYSSSVTCDGFSSRSCSSNRRCGGFTSYSGYVIEMRNCILKRNYVCSAPTGGSYILYSVPALRNTTTFRFVWSWFWIPVTAGLFFVGLFISLIIRKLQRRNRQLPANAAGVTTVTAYPRQQQQQQPPLFTVSSVNQQHPPPPAYGQPAMSYGVYPNAANAGVTVAEGSMPPPAYGEVVGNSNQAFKY